MTSWLLGELRFHIGIDLVSRFGRSSVPFSNGPNHSTQALPVCARPHLHSSSAILNLAILTRSPQHQTVITYSSYLTSSPSIFFSLCNLSQPCHFSSVCCWFDSQHHLLFFFQIHFHNCPTHPVSLFFDSQNSLH